MPPAQIAGGHVQGDGQNDVDAHGDEDAGPVIGDGPAPDQAEEHRPQGDGQHQVDPIADGHGNAFLFHVAHLLKPFP